ncbi:Gp19/Gp15/Gp42 family protein [Nocardia rhamnosiphila]|uniref:Gp19/Gp15/Gp42 family protein n=1 Tax=Nocardia rhamnosiphila TaxID=426716 RepID=UPI0033CA310C
MPTYAEPTDVAARLGRELSPDETTLVTTRLDDAERMIRRRIPDLSEQITAGSIDVEDVKQVEAEAVLRVVRNPEGYRQETDGNYSYMLSAESASGVLDIKPNEWALLGIRTGGMFFIDPSVPTRPGRTAFGNGG